MGKNNIFISWSGKRSLYAAEALREWLPNVIQAAKPWMSERDIEKGARGLTEVGNALEGMKVGIICLTPENLDAAWVLYEAGALSKTFSDDKTRVCTYLLGGLQPQNVKPPLSMFQWTKAEKEDTRKLVQTINTAIAEEPLSEERLNNIFGVWWSQLETKLNSLPVPEKVVDVTRDPNEMISEILELCREYLPTVSKSQWPSLSSRQMFDLLQHSLVDTGAPAEARSVIVRFKGAEPDRLLYKATRVMEYAPGSIVISFVDGRTAGYTNVASWSYGPTEPPSPG
jgi:hypothetical protein